LELVAERFKALAEPSRLRILEALRRSERTVSDLMADTRLGQANVSKHLQVLHAAGFVTRRKEGVSAYYTIADPDVFALCDLVCGRIDRELAAQRRALR
jgi:ArsR family transcriptional regulator